VFSQRRALLSWCLVDLHVAGRLPVCVVDSFLLDTASLTVRLSRRIAYMYVHRPTYNRVLFC